MTECLLGSSNCSSSSLGSASGSNSSRNMGMELDLESGLGPGLGLSSGLSLQSLDLHCAGFPFDVNACVGGTTTTPLPTSCIRLLKHFMLNK
jgi:hypothetical protein